MFPFGAGVVDFTVVCVSRQAVARDAIAASLAAAGSASIDSEARPSKISRLFKQTTTFTVLLSSVFTKDATARKRIQAGIAGVSQAISLRVKIGLAFAAYWIICLFNSKCLDTKIQLMEADLKEAQASLPPGI